MYNIYVTPKNIESTSNCQIDLDVRETGPQGGKMTLSKTYIFVTFVVEYKRQEWEQMYRPFPFRALSHDLDLLGSWRLLHTLPDG